MLCAQFASPNLPPRKQVREIEQCSHEDCHVSVSPIPSFSPEGFFNNSLGWVNAVGYLAAAFSVATYSMKTIIPLRIAAICASILLLIYGYLAPSYPQIILNAVLLPLNAFRLRQMIALIEDVKSSSIGDELALDWLSSFGTKRS